MRLPDFLIIGAQRAGTTWLYKNLRAHPEVFMPEQKELEFFSYDAPFHELGVSGYAARYFGGSEEAAAVGEATPSYLWASQEYPEWLKRPPGFSSEIPRRVRDTPGPDTRLVVSLRHPVSRAVSAYLHHVRRGRYTLDKGILELGAHAGIVHMGFYAAHLRAWLKAFPIANFHILIFEEATAHPKRTLGALCRFLGVDDDFRTDWSDAPANRGLLTRHGVHGVEVRLSPDEASSWEVAVSQQDLEHLNRLLRRHHRGEQDDGA